MIELHRLVLRLSVMSQIPAAPVGHSSHGSDEDIGGKRPGEPTGLRMMEDYQVGYALKSPEYFQREIGRARTEKRLRELLSEAQAALEAWQRTPIPAGQDPEYGSPQWKRWIAESSLDGGTLARRFNITRQYVHQIRRGYRDVV
jgi:hypothetical protein